MIGLVDTLRAVHVESSSSTALVGLVLAIAGFGLTAVVALLRVGVMIGRHEEFKEAVNKDLKELKASDNHAITREEMDARFGQMRSEISAVKDRMGDIVTIVRDALSGLTSARRDP